MTISIFNLFGNFKLSIKCKVWHLKKIVSFLLKIDLVLIYLLQWILFGDIISFYTLLFKRNIIWIISLKRSKKVVIKIGDVLILVKIIQVNCIGNLCLDFNFGKNLLKIVPYSIKKGLMGPKLEFSA